MGKKAADKLKEARCKAFKEPGVSLDSSRSTVPPLALYSGFMYKVPCFKKLVCEALGKGVHCLIMSGGYGIVRPEEPIHPYEANMPKTSKVWKHCLPDILSSYITRNNINRVFVACSAQYARILFGPRGTLWMPKTAQVYCYVPRIQSGQGAQRKVPTLIGKAIVGLISSGMAPDKRWT